MAGTARCRRYVARGDRHVRRHSTPDSVDARDLSRGLIGAAVAVCAWSTGTILAKYIDMGSLAIGFYRFAFFGLVIIVWMRVRGTPFRLRIIRDSMWGGIALGGDIALFFSAVKLTSIVNATIIGSMQPVVVGVIAATVLRREDRAAQRRLVAGGAGWCDRGGCLRRQPGHQRPPR